MYTNITSHFHSTQSSAVVAEVILNPWIGHLPVNQTIHKWEN